MQCHELPSPFRPVVLMLGIGLICLGCDTGPASSPAETARTFTFANGQAGWTGLFADYPVDADTTDDGMALTVGRRPLPSTVPDGHGLFLSGRNTSDDLFMGARRSLTGLSPNTTYDLRVNLTLASAAPSDCVGIGGPPGEAVWVKAGAAPTKPTRTVDDTGWYRLTLDKGGQSRGGTQARVLGTAANGATNCSDPPFRHIKRTMDTPLPVTTDGDGTLWLLVGTDSGFEGPTRLYYDTIQVSLTARRE